jgi:cytochrome c biogenesis protein CcmG/thiol:disulfide interchange protein DsbE
MKKTAPPQESNQRAWVIASVVLLIAGVAVTAAIFAFSPGGPESKPAEGSGSDDRLSTSKPAQPSTGTSGGGQPSAASPAKSASTASSTAAPAVTADLDKSLEGYRGKVVIVDLWTTWCPPCRRGIPDFIALQDEYRDKGLEVIGVSLDPVDARGGGGAAAVPPFMQQFGINYTIWMVNDFKALGSYPLGQGYPTTYIIDRQGRTVRQYVGLRPKEVFENDIKQLL